MKKFFSLIFLLSIFSLYGAKVAIIDSGTDYKHKELMDKIWENPNEIPDNLIDEDGNGYQDDVYGWNFAENNNQVIDYQYLGSLTAEMKLFFLVQAKMIEGTASEEEEQWLRERVQDQDVKKLQSEFLPGQLEALHGKKKKDEIEENGIFLFFTNAKGI